MVAGHLQEKYGIFYIVLSYKDSSGKRKVKWESTGLPVKKNKKKAEALLWNGDGLLFLHRNRRKSAWMTRFFFRLSGQMAGSCQKLRSAHHLRKLSDYDPECDCALLPKERHPAGGSESS